MRWFVRSLVLFLCLAGTAGAQEPVPESDTAKLLKEMQELRKAMQEQQRAFDEKLGALQARIDELEKAKGATPGAPAAPAGPTGATAQTGPAQPSRPSQGKMTEEEKKKLEEEFAQALGGGEKGGGKPAPPAPEAATAPAAGPAPIAAVGALKLIDVAFDILTTGGFSTATEDSMRALEGGGHDPKNRGFTVANDELTLSGVVDPYFRGDANIVLQITDEGETTIELEEAYLTTQALPAGLQVKAGQFFSAFGRLNAMHPHTWDFVDQPVVSSRFLGEDGLRSQGVQLSWLMPLPFFAELTGSVQNAQGGTAASFRDVPGDSRAGRILLDRPVRSLADLLYVTRLKTSFDLTDEITIVPGISAAFGPNATGQDTRTEIYGVDLYAKWKPLTNEQGFPFLAWQSEAMMRRYDAEHVLVDVPDAATGADTIAVDSETLDDWGFYSQLVWGFARPWTLGLRYDYAAGEHNEFDLGPAFGLDRAYDSAGDPFRDHRERVSLDLTYYPSEFSKLRIQYNWDRSSFLPENDAHGVFLQAEILFGAHGAHKF